MQAATPLRDLSERGGETRLQATQKLRSRKQNAPHL